MKPAQLLGGAFDHILKLTTAVTDGVTAHGLEHRFGTGVGPGIIRVSLSCTAREMPIQHLKKWS